MKSFEFESIEEAYPVLLKVLLLEGTEVSPRGSLTKEITPIGITINNPRKRVITHPVRKLNYGFMVGELLWIIQGRNDLSVAHYNKQWLNYSDDGETLNGAYGQRIFKWDGAFDVIDESYTDEDGNTHPSFELQQVLVNQFEKAYEQLKNDNDTRQATIALFNPTQDYRETKDKPCTNLMRFTIRNGKLNMFVVMRSNDIWLGFPYDVFNFTMLQEIMAGKLGIDVGKYTHVVDSLHIYEQHFEIAKKVINTPHPFLYEDILEDARICQSDLDLEMINVYNIEATTRTMGDVISLKKVEEMLYSIDNLYWRSLAGVIATYNFKKFKREEFEINALRESITNEFKELL
jgi:thymidylate synthase